MCSSSPLIDGTFGKSLGKTVPKTLRDPNDCNSILEQRWFNPDYPDSSSTTSPSDSTATATGGGLASETTAGGIDLDGNSGIYLINLIAGIVLVTLAALCAAPCCIYTVADGVRALGRVRRRWAASADTESTD